MMSFLLIISLTFMTVLLFLLRADVVTVSDLFASDDVDYFNDVATVSDFTDIVSIASLTYTDSVYAFTAVVAVYDLFVVISVSDISDSAAVPNLSTFFDVATVASINFL